jgi:hypothetical protein
MRNSAATFAAQAVNTDFSSRWRYIHSTEEACWASTMACPSLPNSVPLKALYRREDGLVQPWTHQIISPNRLYSARGSDSIQAWFAARCAVLPYSLCKGKIPELQQLADGFWCFVFTSNELWYSSKKNFPEEMTGDRFLWQWYHFQIL